jgi:hypothetical protein
MALARRVTIAAATLLSAPGVLLAAAACLYIFYSILTEAWYRAWFASYGVTMAVLYVAFVAGVFAVASLAMRNTRKALAFILAATGFAAAVVLDLELHDEAERVLPFGLLFGPYIAWALAWLVLRSHPAPPPPPAWQDTRM